MGSTDFLSMKRVWKSYHNVVWASEDIFEIGFNENSGYVYIALENGVSIASCFGQSVEYMVNNKLNVFWFYGKNKINILSNHLFKDGLDVYNMHADFCRVIKRKRKKYY